MRNESQRRRFALESPSPECFSALLASGRADDCLPWHSIHAGHMARFAEPLTDDVARSLWSPRKRGTARVAALVAGFCSDPELLADMLEFDKRTTVIGAAVSNPSCPLELLFEQAALWVDKDAGSPTFNTIRHRLEDRFAEMPIEVALTSLRDGLHTEVFERVAARSELTFELAEPYLASSWVLLVPNRLDGWSISFVEALAASESVALQWSPTQIAGFFAVPGVDGAAMAFALMGANPALALDRLVGPLLVAAAKPPPPPAPGDGSVGLAAAPAVVSPAAALSAVLGAAAFDRVHSSRVQRAAALAKRLLACPELATPLVEVLFSWYGDPSHHLAHTVIEHPNAEVSWWAGAPFNSMVGSVAAARLLVRDARFLDPSLWVAADVLGDSWHGTVGDFVEAAQALLT